VNAMSSLSTMSHAKRWLRFAFVAFLALGSSASVYCAEKIVIKGSDTLGAKMVQRWREEFKAINASNGIEVIFEIAAEGSSTGIAAVIDATADLGMSSREVKKTEQSKALLKGVRIGAFEIARDGIAIVVNEGNPMGGITAREVEKIFTGDVDNWSSINGTVSKISIYTRNTSSGTYSVFQSLALRRRDYASFSQKMAGNEQIAAEVAKNPAGVGYVGLAYLRTPGLKALPVAGVMPNSADYPFARPLYFYFDRNKTLRPIVQDFVDFCLSAEGQKIVEEVDFIAVR